MAQDYRPFRSGARALFLLALVTFACGIWAELRSPAGDTIALTLADMALRLGAILPAPLHAPETAFGTFANIAGLLALAGLLLTTLRQRAPAADPAPVAPAMPRVTPRRPADLRAARTPRPAV